MTGEPFWTWVPTGGTVPTTEPAAPPGSSSCWSTTKPAASSVLRASIALSPVTSGTATPVGAVPIVMLTGLAPLTGVPALGSELMTFPTCPGSVSAGFWAPTLRPASLSAAVASATLSPTTRGTVTWADPAEDNATGDAVVLLSNSQPPAPSTTTTAAAASTYQRVRPGLPARVAPGGAQSGGGPP